tara:strand:+ start:316 stop:576 length:261 start_codon:yes stop_codon:yes gene_type:complete
MNKKENSILEQSDTIVTSVVEKYLERSRVGKQKYGTTLDREDLDKIQWLVHLQEELMDATLYIEKLKKELENYKKENKNNNECIIS